MIPGYFRVCLTANENLIDPTNIESKNPERKMIVKHQFMKALYYELFLIPKKHKYSNFTIVLIFLTLILCLFYFSLRKNFLYRTKLYVICKSQ
jgi:hypothetical protein